MKKAYEKLSAVERKFVEAYMGGATKSDAYRASHSDAGKLTSRQVSSKAHQFIKEHPRVTAEIERLEAEALDNAVITRDELTRGIVKLYNAALESSLTNVEGVDYLVSDKSAKVALAASERLSKLLGYDAPEQTNGKVTVVFEGEAKEYAE